MSLWPGMPLGEDLDKLPAPYVADLQQRWNQWLLAKYRTDATLLAAWSKNFDPPGPSVVKPATAWYLNQSNGAAATLTSQPSSQDQTLDEASVKIEQSTGSDWHVQLIHAGIDLEPGKRYSVLFECRSQSPGQLRVSVDRDRDDYRAVGLNETLQTTNDWEQYAFTFMAADYRPGLTQLVFHLGLLKDVELRAVRMIRGYSQPVLAKGQSLAQANVSIAPTTDTAQQDWIDFLAQVDRSYSDSFRDFLRNELKLQNLICDSQVQWGGTTGYYRELGSDFIDTHAYWQHPEFLGGSWNPEHWKVERRSQVADIASGDSTVLIELARVRQLGKPFTVSEYDHPSVNDYQVEMLPMVASFGCLQDWDGLYFFGHGPIAADQDRITGYFDQTGNPAKFAFYPSLGRIFREQMLRPAAARLFKTVQVGTWHQAPNATELWNGPQDKVNQALTHRLGVRVLEDTRSRVIPTDASTATSDNAATLDNSIQLTPNSLGAVWSANSPSAIVCTGFIGDQQLELDSATLQFGKLPDQFGSFTLVTLDDQPISQSSRMLLTAAGRSENRSMGWNEDRTSVGNRWGQGPVQIEAVDASITLNAEVATKVFALNSKGERTQQLKTKQVGNQLQFQIAPVHQTVWYEITK